MDSSLLLSLSYRRAALVKNTLERYMNSADQDLTFQHVPETDKENQPLPDDFRLKVCDRGEPLYQ